MTQDEIDELLIKKSMAILKLIHEFADLEVAKEREACAKVCDELVNEENSGDYRNAANWCSIRIRARGEA
jgi:predicted Mrr-cat superfamily restriction endonuclease